MSTRFSARALHAPTHVPTTKTDHRARGGLLIILGLLATAVLIFNLGDIAELTRDRLDLVVVVPEAPGVRVGTRVWVEGVESGRVRNVHFVPGADSVEVALDVRLEGRTRSALRADSDARAFRERFVGMPVVVLEGGSPGAPGVADGDTLRGSTYLDTTELLERARALPDELAALLERAQTVGSMVESRRPALAALGRQVDTAAAAAGALSADMEGGSLAQILAEDGLAPRLASLRERLAGVSEALDDITSRQTPEGEQELVAALGSLRQRVERLREDVDGLAGERGGGILTRMARDSAITVAIRGVQAQMDSVRAEAASILRRMMIP